MSFLQKAAAAAMMTFACAGGAFAQSPALDWTGFYAGVGAGFGWGTADHRPGSGSITGANDLSPSGFVGGVQAGYNWQFSNGFVLGAEISADMAGMTDSCEQGSDPGDCMPSGAPDTEEKIQSIVAFKARFGVAMGTVLPYVSAGLAAASTSRISSAGGGQTISQGYGGPTVGVGIEWAFAPEWSLNVGYQYTDLGTQTYVFPIGNDPIVHLTTSTFRFGLNKHF
jgi:outer membrane immunogenic protein